MKDYVQVLASFETGLAGRYETLSFGEFEVARREFIQEVDRQILLAYSREV